uniref:Uncharacterized protein n=1 Tax=Anguilla anguilla TaxID=7936 RepID=A0A0E9QUY0_ANGAN
MIIVLLNITIFGISRYQVLSKKKITFTTLSVYLWLCRLLF